MNRKAIVVAGGAVTCWLLLNYYLKNAQSNKLINNQEQPKEVDDGGIKQQQQQQQQSFIFTKLEKDLKRNKRELLDHLHEVINKLNQDGEDVKQNVAAFLKEISRIMATTTHGYAIRENCFYIIGDVAYIYITGQIWDFSSAVSTPPSVSLGYMKYKSIYRLIMVGLKDSDTTVAIDSLHSYTKVMPYLAIMKDIYYQSFVVIGIALDHGQIDIAKKAIHVIHANLLKKENYLIIISIKPAITLYLAILDKISSFLSSSSSSSSSIYDTYLEINNNIFDILSIQTTHFFDDRTYIERLIHILYMYCFRGLDNDINILQSIPYEINQLRQKVNNDQLSSLDNLIYNVGRFQPQSDLRLVIIKLVKSFKSNAMSSTSTGWKHKYCSLKFMTKFNIGDSIIMDEKEKDEFSMKIILKYVEDNNPLVKFACLEYLLNNSCLFDRQVKFDIITRTFSSNQHTPYPPLEEYICLAILNQSEIEQFINAGHSPRILFAIETTLKSSNNLSSITAAVYILRKIISSDDQTINNIYHQLHIRFMSLVLSVLERYGEEYYNIFETSMDIIIQLNRRNGMVLFSKKYMHRIMIVLSGSIHTNRLFNSFSFLESYLMDNLIRIFGPNLNIYTPFFMKQLHFLINPELEGIKQNTLLNTARFLSSFIQLAVVIEDKIYPYHGYIIYRSISLMNIPATNSAIRMYLPALLIVFFNSFINKYGLYHDESIELFKDIFSALINAPTEQFIGATLNRLSSIQTLIQLGVKLTESQILSLVKLYQPLMTAIPTLPREPFLSATQQISYPISSTVFTNLIKYNKETSIPIITSIMLPFMVETITNNFAQTYTAATHLQSSFINDILIELCYQCDGDSKILNHIIPVFITILCNCSIQNFGSQDRLYYPSIRGLKHAALTCNPQSHFKPYLKKSLEILATLVIVYGSIYEDTYENKDRDPTKFPYRDESIIAYREIVNKYNPTEIEIDHTIMSKLDS